MDIQECMEDAGRFMERRIKKRPFSVTLGSFGIGIVLGMVATLLIRSFRS